MGGIAKKHLVEDEWMTIMEACVKYDEKYPKITSRMSRLAISLEEALLLEVTDSSNNRGNDEWQNMSGTKNRLGDKI